jgi:hypothetical protein
MALRNLNIKGLEALNHQREKLEKQQWMEYTWFISLGQRSAEH